MAGASSTGQMGSKIAPENIGPVSKEASDQYIDAMTKYLGDRDSAVAAFNGGLSAINTYIFPNLLLVSNHVINVQPVAPDYTIVYFFAVQFEGAPDEINRARMRACNLTQGPASFIGPDDFEIFERTQEGLKACEPEWCMINRGMHREVVEGEDLVGGTLTDDVVLRGIWRRYLQVMSSQRDHQVAGV